MDAGRIGLVFRGNYSIATSYEYLDVVFYGVDGCSYVAIKDAIGKLPTDTEYWQKLAEGAVNKVDVVEDGNMNQVTSNAVYDAIVAESNTTDTKIATVDAKIVKATSSSIGMVKPDNTTISINNGVLSTIADSRIATLQSNLTAGNVPFRFGINSEGKYGYILTESGADTVIPFKNGIEFEKAIPKGYYICSGNYTPTAIPSSGVIGVSSRYGGIIIANVSGCGYTFYIPVNYLGNIVINNDGTMNAISQTVSNVSLDENSEIVIVERKDSGTAFGLTFTRGA